MLCYLTIFWLCIPLGLAKVQQQILDPQSSVFPKLNFSAPSPLIFQSVFGLLQQWPNTFFEFGHTIVPCKIPKHTNLYHASEDADPLPSPEWFAFDAAMSYSILGTLPNSHMFTYRTQQEIRCLYFDGASASLKHEGNLDSQMTFIYNSSANVPERPILKIPPQWRNFTGNSTFYDNMPLEFARAKALCTFIHDRRLGGPGWGYEGIVRMNAGFEMIWCNFSSPSAKLISQLNVSAPALDDVPLHPLRTFDNPFVAAGMFGWYRAATKRHGFVGGVAGRGESRVQLDTCGLFTLYDPRMLDQESARVRSERSALNLTVEGYWRSPENEDRKEAALMELRRRRRTQRAGNVSIADGLYMRRTVEARMRQAFTTTEDRLCSGIDWLNVARDIVSAYSVELHDLSKLLGRCKDLTLSDARDWLAHVRSISHDFYMPFYEYPQFTKQTLRIDFEVSAPNSLAALERCKTQYEPTETSLAESEGLIYSAVSDVLSAICNTLLPIFLHTERTWLENFNNASVFAPPPLSGVLDELRHANFHNRRAVESLMAWLGWEEQWTACEPNCNIGEVCYIPIWPLVTAPALLKIGTRPDNRTYEEIDKLLQGYLWRPTCVNAQNFPPV